MAKRFLFYLDELLKIRAEMLVQNIQRVRATIDQSIQGQEEKIQKAADGIEEPERTEFINEAADEQMNWGDASQFVNRSMLTSAYAHFEDGLKRICKHCTKLGLTQEIVKLKGFHIQHAKKHLEGITVGTMIFDPTAFGTAWKKIDEGWRNLRNCLVHDGGTIDFSRGVTARTDDLFASTQATSPDEVADAVAIRTFLSGRTDAREEMGELVLENQAAENFLTAAKSAVEAIMNELDRIAPASPSEPTRRAR